MIRSIIALAMLLASALAHAQTQNLATQQVQLLAPQLELFAGSSANFDSLVTGLTTGAPVTLNTVAADGSLQTVTFMPGTRLAPTDAARILETVRQNLIARGIATPTGDQIAAALVGGTITSPSATSPIAGLLTGSSVPATPVQVRTAAAFTPGSTSANLTTAELQAIRNTLATGSGLARSGLAMNEVQIAQSLQLAATVLAQQGILDPTADQLRAALFGGTLVTSTGRAVALQGVLQGQVRNTSDSPTVNTSASPSFHTSASPTVNTSATPIRTAPAAASAGQSVAPRTAGQR
jgi:hypothetical protein